MQHRDWIEKATQTAREENDLALQTIAAKIPAEEDSVSIFNPTALARQELVETENGTAIANIPPFGYKALKKSALPDSQPETQKPIAPPVIENTYYKISFAENGGIKSIFDKTQGRELLDQNSPYRVCAVNKAGKAGPFSREFCGITKELLEGRK